MGLVSAAVPFTERGNCSPNWLFPEKENFSMLVSMKQTQRDTTATFHSLIMDTELNRDLSRAATHGLSKPM